MTDERRDALAWLDKMLACTRPDSDAERSARALRRMLAEPRLPAEPPHWEVLAAMMRALNEAPDGDWVRKWEAAYRALYAHLTAPKEAEVERPAKESPPSVTINQTGTNANHVIETCVEVLVRAGMLTVDGAIGERINRRIADRKPGTKMVDVWRVEFAQCNEPYSATFRSRSLAEAYSRTVALWPNVDCIHVTGPHKQEVPA